MILALLSLAVLLVCGYMVGSELLSRQKEKEDFEQLAELIAVEKSTASPAPTGSPPADKQPGPAATSSPDSQESQEQRRDLSELFAMNEDFVGWLCIPDTDINYPVMHTPDEPERYLCRDFQGEYSESGVPFLDFRCSLDSGNLIIYGHNMMNGTMFAALQGYVQEDFCEQHPIIEFQTADGCEEYQLFAVAWVKSNDEWYKFVSADAAEDFNSAVDKVMSKALFTINSAPEYGSQILTLSTCYDSAHNGRLLVLAAKL